MKVLLISVIWIIAFFLLSIFKFSASDAPSTSRSTSLVKRSSDLVPSTRHETALVATLDGTLSLVEIESRKILWSIKTGLPIYSSFQASRNLDANSEIAAELGDDVYIDCGDDWNLYRHDRSKGIVERLKSAKDLIRETKGLCKNGTAVIGQMATTVLVVDAKTGAVIHTVRFSDSAGLGFEDEENSPLIREDSKELIAITRTDYSFLAYSKLSGKVLWNVTLAEFEAESYCKVEDSILGNSQDQFRSLFKGDSEMSSSCFGRTLVYRIRDRGYSALISDAGLIDEMPKSLPGDRVLPLPAPDHSHLPVPVGGISSARYNPNLVLALPSPESAPPVQPSELLALPSSEVQAGNYIENTVYPGSSKAHSFLSLILSGLLLLLPVGCAMYRSILVREKKLIEDAKSKATTPKKKKPRKSGNSKNNSGAINVTGAVSNSEDGGLTRLSHLEAVDKMSQSIRTGLVNLQVDGRNIGQLWVSSNEIAKGSNGTIVLQGTYGGRPVAVKRLVRTHYDVAEKEIQNLVASDQHPNIVRFYGVECDSDFVYLSLERCLCSLNDLIYHQSVTSQDAMNTNAVDVESISVSIVQLPESIANDKDLELWKANGYPSPQLLKLMRDVVSGVAHLHELGFIHRDLKPQNVLIIKDRVLCAKLSDMGISKRLIGDVSSLTHHATGAGSSGWRAPEQILHGRQTRAVDLFSLGCLLFFCMTGGEHPFGDVFERDANIVKNQKDLFLVEHVPEAVDLISCLLDPNPELRPKAMEVLDHPLFWNSERRLSFLRDASDRVELEDRETDSQLLKALEATASVALNGKWDEKLESSFLTNISRYRRYKYDSVRDLLRVIRNKLNHYRELPPEIQEVLGSVPEGFDNYFTVRFPKLLIEVYRVIYVYCQEEELLGKYFKSSLL